MGGQTGSQKEQSVQTTQLPPWINEAAQQNYGFAQNIASRPLQQYQGQMVPDTAPQLQQSWNTAATAGNAGLPQYSAATAGYAGALGQTPMSVNPQMLRDTNLDPYMNPYTKNVIDASLPIMQQELGKTLASNAGTAAQTGAFGGSRFGVQQGTAQAQGALGMAKMAADLNAANFGQAQTAATGDISRDLTAQTANQAAQQAKINSDIQASQGMAGVGTNLQNAATNAYNMQKDAGATQMAQAQNQINAQMQKFQQAWGYPTQQLGILQSALGMTPYGQTMTGQKETETYTPMDWGALAGKGLGLVQSMLPSPTSDKRLKKNLKRVGKHESGVPVYDYNWKGEPAGAPKTRGPMAQDVEKVMPGAVVEDDMGVKHVHAPVLGALSRPAPRGQHGAMGGLIPMSRTQHRRRIRPPQIRGALGGG